MTTFTTTTLQRGILEQLLARGKPLQVEIIAAIWDWDIPEDLKGATIQITGEEGRKNLMKIFPVSFCDYLYTRDK